MGQLGNVARLVIGAPHGRAGKTTVGIGLIGALRDRGYTVQPFKKGPDYIDPSWLGYVAGRPCRTLDGYWMNASQIRTALVEGAAGADLAIIEGAMGLFDGIDIAGTGSTAQIARLTRTPVILVVDATRITRSVAPVVLGFMNFEPDVTIAGVIFNNVARCRHESMLRAAVEEYCGIPVLGAIPKNACRVLPERHLGLVPVAEHGAVRAAVAGHTAVAAHHLDVEAIVKIAAQAQVLAADTAYGKVCPPVARIGVIRDPAFTFYYPENMEALAAAGAEVISINSMTDIRLPAVDGLYIGGGFPEVFGEAIAANTGLRCSIRRAAEDGLPIYAECGGLMYLGREIVWNGRAFPMCGVLSFTAAVGKEPQGHGYTLMRSLAGNPFFVPGTEVKGHEFHHSRLLGIAPGVRYTYEVIRGHGVDGRRDGILYKNTFATYNHLHATANPGWAKRFVAMAAAWRSGQMPAGHR
jgi:cobyrinic acid a,c-diamide synthase